jgi:pyruvate formate lyase activating enzyme
MKSLPGPVMETCDCVSAGNPQYGSVFDIRRFSLHDGGGIRTTVFLKGCPLRCVWCHNPEGLSLEPQLLYLENQCIHCGTCTKAGKTRAITMRDGRLAIDKGATKDWREVIDACPAACLTMDCNEYTVEELVRVVLKDAVFFRHGGGVTLSGGEPLVQKDFVISLLKAFKQAGIHTAVETCLYACWETVREALNYLDLVYADLKVFDAHRHKDLTGVDNGLIKENIRLLLGSAHKDKVVIRTPLIPTMTASQDNIWAIARFLAQIDPAVKYELLNYNPLAKAKYSLVDLKYCFAENPVMYTEQQMNEFRETAKAAGLRNIIAEA